MVWIACETEEEVDAYFHRDQMIWIFWYHRNHVPSYWQAKESKKWLYNVAHWKRIEKNE